MFVMTKNRKNGDSTYINTANVMFRLAIETVKDAYWWDFQKYLDPISQNFVACDHGIGKVSIKVVENITRINTHTPYLFRSKYAVLNDSAAQRLHFLLPGLTTSQ